MEPLKALNDIDDPSFSDLARVDVLRTAYTTASNRVDDLNTELAAHKGTVEKQLNRIASLESAIGVSDTINQTLVTSIQNILAGNEPFFEWFVDQCQKAGALCQLQDWLSEEISKSTDDIMDADEVRDIVDRAISNADISVEVEVTKFEMS
tara:strand:+ start:133 stop:585 length:453 start_codon:yes stop_codon:yes gene_type:complete